MNYFYGQNVHSKNLKKQVLRNFKFYQTFKPRPYQNSNTFFLKIIKTCLKIYFNPFQLILLKKKFFRSRKKIIRGDPNKKI
jgi:hypothetical protein